MKVQLRARRQITLPEFVVKQLGITEGEDLLIDISDGSVRLIPAVTIPKDERYLFTPEWQAALLQAEQEINEGNTKSFDSIEEFEKHMNSL